MQISTQRGASPTQSAKIAITDESQGQVPDLVVDKFEMQPPFPRPGEQVYFDVKVKNRGAGAASGFNVGVDGTGFPLSEKKVKMLPPQADKTLRFGPMKVKAGSYSFTATADNRHEVTESDESNNWQYLWVNVEDRRPPRNPWPPRQ